MVKIRDLQPTKKAETVKVEADKAAKAEQFGNDALAKKPRAKPANQFKAINIPFTEEDYNDLVKAAEKLDRTPTNFIKLAIKQAVKAELRKKD